MAENKKKQEVLVTKDSLIVGNKKYPKDQPPPEAVQELAKAIQSMLRKDLH